LTSAQKSATVNSIQLSCSACRSEGTQQSLILSSRVLVQRACNHSAVETYRYDVDGKLTGAETDITTWEERNTEIFGWLNKEPPPFEPRQPVNRFRAGGSLPPRNDPTSIKVCFYSFRYDNFVLLMKHQLLSIYLLPQITSLFSIPQPLTNSSNHVAPNFRWSSVR
jgi:hypothetical protein